MLPRALFGSLASSVVTATTAKQKTIRPDLPRLQVQHRFSEEAPEIGCGLRDRFLRDYWLSLRLEETPWAFGAEGRGMPGKGVHLNGYPGLRVGYLQEDSYKMLWNPRRSYNPKR